MGALVVCFWLHTEYFVPVKQSVEEGTPISGAFLRFHILNLPEYINVWARLSAEVELVKIFFWVSISSCLYIVLHFPIVFRVKLYSCCTVYRAQFFAAILPEWSQACSVYSERRAATANFKFLTFIFTFNFKLRLQTSTLNFNFKL